MTGGVEPGATTRSAGFGRRLVRIGAGVAVGLSLAGIVVYASRNSVLGPFVVARASEWLEREHGLTLGVDTLEGGWFSDLKLRGVSLTSLPGAARPLHVHLDELELEHELWRLARGDLAGLHTLRGSGVEARIELDSTSTSSGAGGAGSFDLGALPTWPSVSLERVDLDLRLPQGRTLELRGARASHTAGAIAANLPTIVLDGEWPVLPREFSLVADARRDGERVDFVRLEVGGGAEVRLDGASARFVDGAVQLELPFVSPEARGIARAELGSGAIAVQWRVDELALGQLARWTPRTLELGLEGQLSGAGELHFAGGELWSTAKVRAERLCGLGRELDSVEAEFVLRPGWIDVLGLALRQHENLAWARSLSVPLAQTDLLATLRASRGEIELAVHDVGELRAGDVGPLPEHRLTLVGRLDEQGVELQSGRLDTSTGRLVVRRGRVVWGEPLEERTQLDIDADVLFRDLGELGPLVDERPWSGSLLGTLHVAGPLAGPSGLLALRGEDVVASGYELGAATLRARIEGTRAEVDLLRTDGKLGALSATGAVELSERRIERAQLRLEVPRLDVLLPETFERGAVALEADLSGPFLEPLGSFSLDAFDLAVAGVELASVRAKGRLEHGRVIADELAASSEGVDVRAQAALVHDRWRGPYLLQVGSAIAARDGLALVLDRPAAIEFGVGRISAPSLSFTGLRGRLDGSVERADDVLDIDARVEHLDPMPLVAPFLPRGSSIGSLDGRVLLHRAQGTHELHADLRVTECVALADLPAFDVELVGRAGGERATLERLVLRTKVGIGIEASGEVPFDSAEPWKWRDGVLQVRANATVEDASVVPWPRLGLPAQLAGRVALRLVAAGRPPDLRGSLELDGSGLALHALENDGVLAGMHASDGALTLRVVLEQGVRVASLELKAQPALELSAKGTLLSRDGVAALFEAPASALERAGLDLHARWELADIGVVESLLSKVRRLRGATSGSLDLSGTLARPELAGRIALRGGELRLESGLPPIERVEGSALFDGRKLTIESLVGELGAGPFELEGAIDLSGATPHFALRLKGRELLLVQRRDLRLRADGELALNGPLEALTLVGDLSTQDSRWTRNFDWFAPRQRKRGGGSREASPPLFSIAEGPLAALRFDLRLSGGDPFRVDSNVLKGSLRPNLALTGTGKAPVLSGALFLDPTQVLLPAATLELRAGTLSVDRSDPLDPRLDATLAARVRGYDVAVRVTGSVSEPELELSSVPPLSSEDILLLLLTGRMPGTALDRDQGADAAETVIVFLGRDLLTRLLSGEGESADALLERIELQTGADVTQTGGSTAQVRVRVAGAAQGEGRAVYLRGERDIYDRYNYGLRFVLRLR